MPLGLCRGLQQESSFSLSCNLCGLKRAVSSRQTRHTNRQRYPLKKHVISLSNPLCAKVEVDAITMKSGTTGANRFLDETFGVWMSSIKQQVCEVHLEWS